ncbi:hypothetical protein [Bartonella ancashensis]|uniref:Uncharacterized protein n=1 Tax=Bartonella ancashensis TaxID=1318743 RepID=A0A0M3T2L6_9HYPH|nr:hypothetical protein [Bartonella ancashensis]ALE03061.1 hypothetical protein PU02_0247 [Bartonella ancashensis]
MTLFPFSIADIDDPDHIRIVFYSNGRMGHAPLNAILKYLRSEVQLTNERNAKDNAQMLQRISSLEERVKTVINSEKEIDNHACGEKNDET